MSPPGLIQQDDGPDDPSNRFSLRNGKSGRINEQTFERVLERKNLEHLELEACRINDADLERIGRLTKLRTLRLHRNFDIDGTGLNHLANLQSLEVLDLSASRITDSGFSDLKSLSKLKQLYLGNSQITGASLETIAQFESLEKLVIPRVCCVDRIAKLNRLNNLQSIQFEGSSTGIDRTNLANAFELLVHHQGRSAEQAFRVLFPSRDVEESAPVTTVLFNNHNFNLPRVDDRIIPFLSQMKHLESLALIHSGVSDDGFKTYEFPSTLTKLTLAGISVSDATMKRIGTCTSLTHLHIHSAEDDSLVHLANLTRLQTLGLSACPIGREGLAHLSKLSNVVSLNLSSTHIGNADIKILQKLPALQRLNLSRLKIGDEAMKAIGAMPNLTELSLAQTNLTDAGLMEIGKLTNLQILNLNETMITDAGLRNLPNLSSLKDISTSETAVTGGGLIKLYQAMGLDPITILKREGVFVSKDSNDDISLRFVGRTDRDFQVEHFSLVSEIDGVKRIRMFRISATDDCLEILSGLSGLENLYCYHCKQFGDKGLAAIAKVDSLQKLTLIGSDDVTNAGVAALKNLTRIESLNLRLSNVSEEALEKLRVAMPKCKITGR